MPLTLAEARRRAADLDRVSYAVDLDLTDPARFRSTVTVRFRSRSGSTFLELADAGEVAVTVDGHVAAVAYDGARLRLEGLGTGRAHEVTVRAYLPYVSDGEGMHAFTDPVDGERYLGAYLGVDLTQRVFACFDQPDLKATVSLRVRGQPGWTVLANGRVVRDGAADGQWGFETTREIPVNQFVVCAGRWASIRWVHQGREFGWHARRSLAPALERDSADLQRVTMACFAHYARLFTTPYQFGSYHQVFVPGQNWGAQETPGCVMYRDELLPPTDDATTRQRRAAIIAHEMAHMWFGNLATLRWYEDIWLNESFADYLGSRVAAEAAGYPGARIDFEVAQKPFGYVADARSTTHPVAASAADVPDSSTAASNFDAISYAKGHAVIEALATWLGDARFFAGVNAYLERFAFANAGLDDFVEALAAVAPDQDVVGWARMWLRTTGFDRIEVVDTHTDTHSDTDTDTDTHSDTRGDSGGGPWLRRRGSRQHRISVAAFNESLALVDLRQIELGSGAVALPGWQDLIILPNAGGETFARVVPRPRDTAMLRGGLSRVADPLHRAQVWSGVFASLHAGELSTVELSALVGSQLPPESDPSIVRSVTGWTLGRGVQVCRSAPEVQAVFAAVADACHSRLSRSADAADPSTAAFVDAAARTCADRSTAQRWLDGGQLHGVTLGLRQRWLLVWRLVELGADAQELVDASVSRGDSAQVQDWAARARAADPGHAAKRAAWAEALAVGSSNRRCSALLEGLWSGGAGSLPAEQVTAYLADVPSLAAARGPGFSALLGSQHPGLALADDQLRRLSDALGGELEPRLRRQWQDWYDDLALMTGARG